VVFEGALEDKCKHGQQGCGGEQDGGPPDEQEGVHAALSVIGVDCS
jgi:hypothetical protein